MSIISNLTWRLKNAGLPVDGVSIGRMNDKKTWRVDYAGQVDEDRKAIAAAIIEAFDVTAAKNIALAEVDLKATDTDLPAVLFDVVSALIRKGVIWEGDLSPISCNVLSQRRNLLAIISNHGAETKDG